MRLTYVVTDQTLPPSNQSYSLIPVTTNLSYKGTTINELGVGLEEIDKKKYGGPSPGKNHFQKVDPQKN